MRRTLLALTLCCSLAPVVKAQEQEHAPWLNAFGRFWGIGYSAGYHAHTNSRLGFHHYSPDHNVVPQPPRGQYANPNLYGGHGSMHGPYGNAFPGAMPGAFSGPMAGTMSGTMAGPGMAPTMAPQLMPSNSQNLVPAPPKPVEPPPNWLKQYMKPGEAAPVRNDDLLNDNAPNDNSPSDRRGVLLTPSLEDSTTSLSITPAQGPIQIGGRPVISVLQQ